MADQKKYYWDTCTWLVLINGEPGVDDCEYVIEQAKAGEAQIWTSTLALAEVYKVKCAGDQKALQAAKDADFEHFIEQGWVMEVQVDHDIAVQSRRLCRKYSKLKKPTDGIHLATAILYNVDEFHTFDGKNLLALDGEIKRQDSKTLKICPPPKRPPFSKGNTELFKEE